jgi:hypothetical protein
MAGYQKEILEDKNQCEQKERCFEPSKTGRCRVACSGHMGMRPEGKNEDEPGKGFIQNNRMAEIPDPDTRDQMLRVVNS